MNVGQMKQDFWIHLFWFGPGCFPYCFQCAVYVQQFAARCSSVQQCAVRSVQQCACAVYSTVQCTVTVGSVEISKIAKFRSGYSFFYCLMG